MSVHRKMDIEYEETRLLVISKMTGRFHTHQDGGIRVIKYLTGRAAKNRNIYVKLNCYSILGK